MKVPTVLRSGDLGFNMTPMIDVVFLLIIFFLVSSHLAKREAQMELDLAESTTADEKVETPSRQLTLNVSADGSLFFAGRPVAQDQLAQRLAAAKQSEGDDWQLVIRSDQQVPYQRIRPILASCKQAGIENTDFGVYLDGTN